MRSGSACLLLLSCPGVSYRRQRTRSAKRQARGHQSRTPDWVRHRRCGELSHSPFTLNELAGNVNVFLLGSQQFLVDHEDNLFPDAGVIKVECGCSRRTDRQRTLLGPGARAAMTPIVAPWTSSGVPPGMQPFTFSDRERFSVRARHRMAPRYSGNCATWNVGPDGGSARPGWRRWGSV
jgi:hypothetical protein